MEEKLGMARIPTPPCPVCGEGGTVIVQMNDYLLWTSPNRPLIQNCFPSLSADLREQILTGYHPGCWDKLFPEEDEIPEDEQGPWSLGMQPVEMVEVEGTLEDFYKRFNLGEAPKS